MLENKYMNEIKNLRQSGEGLAFAEIFKCFRKLPKRSVAIGTNATYYIDKYGVIYEDGVPFFCGETVLEVSAYDNSAAFVTIEGAVYIKKGGNWTKVDNICEDVIHAIAFEYGYFIVSQNGETSLLLRLEAEVNYSVSEVKWDNIADVVACAAFAAGLRNDGTVVCTAKHFMGNGGRVSEWHGIVDIYCFSNALFGITAEGQVLYAYDESNGDLVDNPADIDELKNVIMPVGIVAGYLIALNHDGQLAETEINLLDEALPIGAVLSGVYGNAQSNEYYCVDNNGKLLRYESDISSIGFALIGNFCEVVGTTPIKRFAEDYAAITKEELEEILEDNKKQAEKKKKTSSILKVLLFPMRIIAGVILIFKYMSPVMWLIIIVVVMLALFVREQVNDFVANLLYKLSGLF